MSPSLFFISICFNSRLDTFCTIAFNETSGQNSFQITDPCIPVGGFILTHTLPCHILEERQIVTKKNNNIFHTLLKDKWHAKSIVANHRPFISYKVWKLSITRKYNNHTWQTNPRHCEKETQNIYSNNTSVRNAIAKQPASVILLPAHPASSAHNFVSGMQFFFISASLRMQ